MGEKTFDLVLSLEPTFKFSSCELQVWRAGKVPENV